MAKRMWHLVRAVFYMIRKGLTKQNLLTDLHLLLKCGKIAGKAIGDLLTIHHHQHHHDTTTKNYLSNFSCSTMDPNLAAYAPRGVEFSCSTTPAYRRHHHRRRHHRNAYDAATIAKIFDILNTTNVLEEKEKEKEMVMESPISVREEDGHVDREAEEFIRRFYEELRVQQWVPATPEGWTGGRREAVLGLA